MPILSPGDVSRLLGTAEAMREEGVFVIPPSERPMHEVLIEKVRTQLGEEEFKAAWAEGKAMTYEQAVEYATKCLNDGTAIRQ